MTPDNLDALRTEHQSLERELAVRTGLPPLLAHRLHERLDRLGDFLGRHVDPNTAESAASTTETR
ncbi:hypothetical protein BJF84_21020 [Rhodococcus sp. CUA-806]|nr:hypothetical protein BJF84_21020 [Rhodococcus sp. CUA-806]